MKNLFKKYRSLVSITVFVIVIDQVTKTIVRANIPFGGRWMPVDWLAPYFRFVHWENTGAAFGLFQEGGLVFSILAVIVSIFIVIYYPQIPEEEKLMRVALSMQLGGALGNLVDRIMFGPVTDFISVGNFPVFNIADSSISVGVALLIFALWLNERREAREIDASNSLASEETETVDYQV